MKIKSGYLVREIAGCHIVVPVGGRVIDFKGIMTLNNSGHFLWEHMANDITRNELLTFMLAEYEIDEATARNDMEEFLATARDSGVLEE